MRKRNFTTAKRLVREYLIFVIFYVKKIHAGDFIVSTFKFHRKAALQVTAIPFPFDQIITSDKSQTRL
jgi:hypothetical protein